MLLRGAPWLVSTLLLSNSKKPASEEWWNTMARTAAIECSPRAQSLLPSPPYNWRSPPCGSGTCTLCHDLMPGIGRRSPVQPDQKLFVDQNATRSDQCDKSATKDLLAFLQNRINSQKASSPKLQVEPRSTGVLHHATWFVLEWRVTHKKNVMRERSRCCSCASRSAAGSTASLVLARRRSCKTCNHNSFPRYQENSHRHSKTQAHTPPCMLPPQFLPA